VHVAVEGQSAFVLHVLALQVPAPLQYEPEHSASGSVMLAMKLHTPSEPLPFFAAEQA
jgi:hypothetical protein